ncbi:MFS transporter [Actinomycetospora succinea]|uniref:MFS transporter n=1 Tax=Actinomycetospora succinea TaxID=663603 RepID=A0A4R6VHY3_9PSEU|nr:MFS transporter [Actinomycetospora succinea]TDQ60954.1 MFS transporter [Actinomycetospora succinea]
MLVVVLLGQFMAVLDTTIVNVAAPTIRTDLHASGPGLALSVSGYTLSYAVLLILGARLGDRCGHSRMFCTGLLAFTATSLLCGVAPTTASLVAFRVAQGAAAALMVPQIMSLIQRTSTGAARTRALSLFAATVAGAGILGQIAGGLLVSADVAGTGWRPVFLVNVPVGMGLVVLARRALPRDGGDPTRRLDPAGSVTFGVAILLLVLPLVLGDEAGWPTWCLVSLAGSAVAAGVFLAVERRVETHGGSPILSRRALRAPGLAIGAVALLFAMITYSSQLFTLALHLQSGLGESAARAGLEFAPSAIGFATTSLTWQRLPARWHPRVAPTGLFLAVLGYAGSVAVLHDGSPAGLSLMAVLLVLGAALGLGVSPLVGMTLARVPVEDAADASAVVVTVFQLGQVVGVATLGSLYLSLADVPGAVVSAHAYSWTATGLAIAAITAGGCATLLAARRSDPGHQVVNRP